MEQIITCTEEKTLILKKKILDMVTFEIYIPSCSKWHLR